MSGGQGRGSLSRAQGGRLRARESSWKIPSPAVGHLHREKLLNGRQVILLGEAELVPETHERLLGRREVQRVLHRNEDRCGARVSGTGDACTNNTAGVKTKWDPSRVHDR